MASPQKVKGKSYENAKAKFLTDIFGQTFIRVPTSGAFLGGKNYDRRLDMSDGQVMAFKGDIIPQTIGNSLIVNVSFIKTLNFINYLMSQKY